MFEDSLFDSGARRRPRRTWTQLVSFAIEVVAISVLVVLPLIYTQALPKQMWGNIVEAPPPPAAASPPRQMRRQPQVARTNRDAEDRVFREPSAIPSTISMSHDSDDSTAPPRMGDFVPGGIPQGVPSSVLTDIAKSVIPTVVKPPATQKLRVSSGVAAGMLIQQVKPRYPALAMQARIQGTVVLQAAIGKDGRVENLRLVSGHPMLAPAAIEAVKQWRYRPYLLNGEPVDVDTQINVNFTLGGG